MTFIVEGMIQFDSYKVINLNIPVYLYDHPNKQKALIINATLCYRFDPIFGNSMSYLPIHISFNMGNSMNHNDVKANAEEYSRMRAKDDNDRMAIKSKMSSWSDDFFRQIPSCFLMYRNEDESGSRKPATYRWTDGYYF